MHIRIHPLSFMKVINDVVLQKSLPSLPSVSGRIGTRHLSTYPTTVEKLPKTLGREGKLFWSITFPTSFMTFINESGWIRICINIT